MRFFGRNEFDRVPGSTTSNRGEKIFLNAGSSGLLVSIMTSWTVAARDRLGSAKAAVVAEAAINNERRVIKSDMVVLRLPIGFSLSDRRHADMAPASFCLSILLQFGSLNTQIEPPWLR